MQTVAPPDTVDLAAIRDKLTALSVRLSPLQDDPSAAAIRRELDLAVLLAELGLNYPRLAFRENWESRLNELIRFVEQAVLVGTGGIAKSSAWHDPKTNRGATGYGTPLSNILEG